MEGKKENIVDVNKLLKNKLKDVSVGKIEEAVASAISRLVGEDYKCLVTDVKYSLFSGADFHMKIELSYKED